MSIKFKENFANPNFLVMLKIIVWTQINAEIDIGFTNEASAEFLHQIFKKQK